MKKILGSLFLAAIMLVGMSSVASAATCSNQTITAGFTCTLGGETFLFTNLQFLTPDGASTGALALSGSLTTASGNDVILGFQISGIPVNINVGYTVTGTNMTGVSASYIGSTGSITEAVFNSANVQVTSLFDGANNSNIVVNSGAFSPLSFIRINKDIDARQFSEFTDSVHLSGVPEPMTLSMMGVGLLGLSLISRRRKKN
ncbi:MAG: PEP-CTERM sorting domain-containing protein [Acidobacteriota bacterium]|nr:PEP-CTERM sorting domain-containing protein [Acidobacteriota bacterium]